MPLQRQWELKQPEWVNDCIPEIMDGKNILDFVDPDIEQKLAELEAEEEERAQLVGRTGFGPPRDPSRATRSLWHPHAPLPSPAYGPVPPLLNPDLLPTYSTYSTLSHPARRHWMRTET